MISVGLRCGQLAPIDVLRSCGTNSGILNTLYLYYKEAGVMKLFPRKKIEIVSREEEVLKVKVGQC